jgi:YVTN family beta-propeller protein
LSRLVVALLLAATLGASARPSLTERANATFVTARVPYLPGSVIPLDVNGLAPPYDVDLLGPGSIDGRFYHVPDDARGSALLIAANATGMAQHTLSFLAPPDASRDFIAVASYGEGIVIHDSLPPYAMKSVLAIGGAPGDVAIDPRGTIGTGTTNDASATIVRVRPWSTSTFSDIPFTDEVAFDARSGALFLTNRGLNGAGAISRIAANGMVTQRVLGLTPEGLAVDATHRRVYVANVNDGTVSIVDADTLVELQRIKVVDRVFALALSADGSRLYAVSNQSVTSPFSAAGSVVTVDVAGTRPHVVKRSAPLVFPVGIVLDAQRKRLFVTDEHDDDIDVLDARTLAPVHAPLPTCRTPWKPALDDGKLYVPCARADEVDVFDTSTLRREPGAPFATGDYPLAVAVWHSR